MLPAVDQGELPREEQVGGDHPELLQLDAHAGGADVGNRSLGGQVLDYTLEFHF